MIRYFNYKPYTGRLCKLALLSANTLSVEIKDIYKEKMVLKRQK